jgi:hypothetical protein
MSRRQSGSFFSRIEGSTMAKIVVYLGEQERNALYQLAQREMRVPRAQAALIIRKELARLEMLCIPAKSLNAEQSAPQVLENQA